MYHSNCMMFWKRKIYKDMVKGRVAARCWGEEEGKDELVQHWGFLGKWKHTV